MTISAIFVNCVLIVPENGQGRVKITGMGQYEALRKL